MRLRVHGETNRATRMRRRFYAEDCVTRLLASIVMVIGRLILRCVGMGGHYLCDRQLTNMAEQGEKHEDEDRGTEDHGHYDSRSTIFCQTALPANRAVCCRERNSQLAALDLLPWGTHIVTCMERGLLIGEVAARTGASRKALRLYEARGILPSSQRTAAGYRVYPAGALGVVGFVQVRIGEDANTAVLKAEEWNVLVDLNQSGRLGRI
jgi:hypothetical protein